MSTKLYILNPGQIVNKPSLYSRIYFPDFHILSYKISFPILPFSNSHANVQNVKVILMHSHFALK